jgi:hypothetical protein
LIFVSARRPVRGWDWLPPAFDLDQCGAALSRLLWPSFFEKGEAMTDARTYREAAEELRREARAAREPALRNRLWEYAIEYDERAASLEARMPAEMPPPADAGHASLSA